MTFLCDFHLHSCLSPCASLDMAPAVLARAAKAAGLDAIALTDHNSARNTPAFAAACRREGLHALHGLEVCTVEEIHCLALFDSPAAALAFGEYLYEHLPDFPNVPEKLGDQPVVDADGVILEFVPRYLGNATDIPFSRLPALVAERGGLFIPAHIDRPAFGVLAQLGRLPPEAGPILEITRHRVPEMQAARGATHTLLTFSDAHDPAAIGAAATRIDAPEFTLPALRAALLARRATPVLRP
jgi:3',5'-nucleoside bisphosphate phosphatase